MKRMMIASTLVVLGGLLGGCSTYLDEYAFVPNPAQVVIPQSLQPPATMPVMPPTAQAQAAQPTTIQPAMPPEPAAMDVLATVVGVRRGDPFNHVPEAVEIRLRLENGAMPTVFDPAQVQLVTGSLITLGPGAMDPPQPLNLPPGAQAVIEGIFPLPPKYSTSTLDLSGLRLSVPLTINGRQVQAGMSFQRYISYYAVAPYPGYYPYYGPYFYSYPTFYGRASFGGGRFRR